MKIIHKDKETVIRIRHLLDIIKTDKTSRKTYIDLGIELVKCGMYDQGLLSFQRANKINEDYLSLYNTASLYYMKNDYKNAVLMLEKSRSLNPDFIMTSVLAGISYSRMNNYKAAEINFINVLMSEPANRTALTALSILYHNQGRLKESLRLVNRINSLYKTGENYSKLKTDIISTCKKNNRGDNAGYSNYKEYIKSLPVSIYTDKYGTIEEKIHRLEAGGLKNSKNLISLSLCHLLSGNTDSALEYLFAARDAKAS